MKRNRLELYFLIPLIWVAGNVSAQFQIDAEYRPRFEIRDGFKTLLSEDQKPAYVTSQRSRINLSYLNEGVEIYFSLQDVRVWGDEVYKTDVSVLNVYEAYAGYFFTDALSIRLGRQELSYDNKRLFGPRNWNNVGASHNVGLIRYENNSLNVHYGIAYNNEKEKNFESNYPLDYYKYLTFLWLNFKLTEEFSLSVMNIVDGLQEENSDSKIYNRGTSGFYAKMGSKPIGFDAAFYYQYGQSARGNDLAAYYFSISPFLEVTESLKVLLGLEYFSGDDAFDGNSEENSFDKLYGDGHGPYGHMDYFTEIPKHTKYGGLMDAYLRLTYKTGGNTTAELDIHNFSLTGSIVDTISEPGMIQEADKQLGVEIDFHIKHNFNKSVQFYVGYSTMLANTSMEILKGGDSEKYQQWFWIGFLFKPTLFKHEF